MDVFTINAFVYILTTFFIFRKNRKVNVYLLIWIAYTIIAIMGVVCVKTGAHYSGDIQLGENVSVIPYVFVYVTTCLLAYPFKNFDERRLDFSSIANSGIYRYIPFVMIVFIIVSCTQGFQAYMTLLLGGLGAAYDDAFNGSLVFDYSDNLLKNINEYGFTIYSLCSPFVIFYYLYKIINKKDRVWGNVCCLIICFLPDIFSALSRGSKGALFFTAMNMLFYYIIFKPQFKDKIIRQFKFIGCVVAVLLTIFVVSITMGRLESSGSSRSETDVIICYLGESMPNIGWEFWDKKINHPYGARFFPELADKRMNTDRETQFDYWESKTNVRLRHCKTLWGECYVEFGLMGSSLFILFLFSCWKYIVFRKYSELYMFPLIVYYYQRFVIYGLFNFGFMGYRVHMKFLYLVLFCFLISFVLKKNKI